MIQTIYAICYEDFDDAWTCALTYNEDLAIKIVETLNKRFSKNAHYVVHEKPVISDTEDADTIIENESHIFGFLYDMEAAENLTITITEDSEDESSKD